MNVKIKEQNLRFKISEDELLALLEGHPVHTKVALLDKMLVASINPRGVGKSMAAKLVLDDAEAYLNLCVSPAQLQVLSDIGPSREGIKEKVDGLSITLQVNMPEACHS